MTKSASLYGPMSQMPSDTAPIAYPPAAAEAFNAANAAYRKQDYETALKRADQALKVMPQMVIAHLMRARCLNTMNDLSGAQAAYQAVLAEDPHEFNAHLELGNIHARMGDNSAAEQSYRQAMMARPQDHRSMLAAAKLLAGQDGRSQADRASVYYHRAVVNAGLIGHETLRQVHHDIGRTRLGADLAGPALEALNQAWMVRRLAKGAAEINDDDAALLIDLARAHLRLGLEQDARATLERAARTDGAAALRDIASLCYDANFWEDGIAVLRRAVALHGDDVDSHLALADMLSRCWQLDEAKAALEAAHRITPISDATRHQLSAKIASSMGDADAAIAHHEALVEAGVQYARSSVAMSMLYSAHHSADDIAQRHRDLFAPLGEGAKAPGDFPNDRRTDRPLRIGMVTSDLHRQHPVNLFMQPVLARWPEAELPLTVYFTGTSYDGQTRLARERIAQWRETSHEKLAAQVAADDIDILIDLAGHTSFRTMQCFAQRMAPVQVSYLGYPGSTGVPSMDWILTDATVAPAAHAAQFSEQVKHLPQTVFCFAPEADHPMPELPDILADRPLTFGSFNNVPKLTPDTIALWARAMQEIQGSQILLKAPSFQDAGVCARYRAMFAAEGIDAERVILRGPVALDQMMQEYADVDIGLDPLHYNGGTTTLQAMWMGVPVLTLEGDKFASRMGASFMKAAGLDEYVTADKKAFVRQAAAVAQDRHALLMLKRGLRDRLLSRPAWDVDQFTRDFTTALREIWAESVQA